MTMILKRLDRNGEYVHLGETNGPLGVNYFDHPERDEDYISIFGQTANTLTESSNLQTALANMDPLTYKVVSQNGGGIFVSYDDNTGEFYSMRGSEDGMSWLKLNFGSLSPQPATINKHTILPYYGGASEPDHLVLVHNDDGTGVLSAQVDVTGGMQYVTNPDQSYNPDLMVATENMYGEEYVLCIEGYKFTMARIDSGKLSRISSSREVKALYENRNTTFLGYSKDKECFLVLVDKYNDSAVIAVYVSETYDHDLGWIKGIVRIEEVNLSYWAENLYPPPPEGSEFSSNTLVAATINPNHEKDGWDYRLLFIDPNDSERNSIFQGILNVPNVDDNHSSISYFLIGEVYPTIGESEGSLDPNPDWDDPLSLGFGQASYIRNLVSKRSYTDRDFIGGGGLVGSGYTGFDLISDQYFTMNGQEAEYNSVYDCYQLEYNIHMGGGTYTYHPALVIFPNSSTTINFRFVGQPY